MPPPTLTTCSYAPCVSSTKKPSEPSCRSTLTSSSPRPVFSEVTVRTPERSCVASTRMRSLPEPLQIVTPSANVPLAAALKVIGAGARPLTRISEPGRVGDAHVGVADQRGLVADHQQVAAGAGVDVQRAEDAVQVAAQVVRAVGQAVRGVRAHVHALVAGAERQVRRRRRALDVEDVVARTQRDVRGLDAVVVDAVQARGQRQRAGQRRRVDPADRHARVLAAEQQLVDGAVAAHRDVVGERQRRVGVVRVQDRRDGGQDLGLGRVEGDRAR